MNKADAGLSRLNRRFTIACFVALLMIGGPSVAAYVLIGGVAAQRSGDADEIEVASRQRVLAQRIAVLLADLSALGPDERLLTDLRATRNTFRQQHIGLVQGDPLMNLRGVRSERIGEYYFFGPHRVDQRVNALILAADKALLQGAPLPQEELSAAVGLANGPLMDGMNAVVMRQTLEANAAMARIDRLAHLLLFVTLAMIGFVALALIYPLGRRLRLTGDALVQVHDEMEHLLRHDPPSGLPNRRYLGEFLDMALNHAVRQELRVGVCKLELAGLRLFFEVHGPEVGDKALRRIAEMAREEVRKGDLVARIGVDEFAVVSPAVISTDELVALSRRITARISEPFEVEGVNCDVRAVAAVVHAEMGDVDGDRLLTDVDIAMADAKTKGRDACGVYSPALRAAFDQREQLRSEIKLALDSDEFEPHFQPQICAKTGRIDGFEALARWNHRSRGLLAPAHFLQHAVEFGLGDRLDELIMEKSLDALVYWRNQGLSVPKIGVNFSDAQLRDPFMAEKIKWAVDQRDLQPSHVCIEILETVLMEEASDETAQNIEGLARVGFGLDLDDFGTGHASIGTLQRFNVDRIKIDRSFVTAVDSDEEQQKVTEAMIKLAHSLGAEALAEGVETAEEMRKLQEMGCNYFQGYWIGRPMPLTDVQEWVRGYEVGVNAAQASTAPPPPNHRALRRARLRARAEAQDRQPA